MMDLLNIAYLLSAVLIPLGMCAGAYFAFKQSFSQVLSSSQANAIAAQAAEINVLKDKVSWLDDRHAENQNKIAELNQTIEMIVQAFTDMGWEITIENKKVLLKDPSGKSHSSRIVS
jgi:prefoldin subunit 5